MNVAPTTIMAVLQCGHDPKVVENTVQEPVKVHEKVALQCGHDPKVVENTAGRVPG